MEQAQFSTIKYNGLIDIIVIILQPDGPGEVRQRDRGIERQERGQEAGLYVYVYIFQVYVLYNTLLIKKENFFLLISGNYIIEMRIISVML